LIIENNGEGALAPNAQVLLVCDLMSLYEQSSYPHMNPKFMAGRH
jgi:hypothetical protein